MPDTAEDGIAVVFRAQTLLGPIAAQRRLEVSGRSDVWSAGQAAQE
jgi:hypothetical protein